MSSSLFDQLFNCCDVPDCTNVSQISNDHSTCSNNSNSKGTTNGRDAYYANINKSLSNDAQKKYSFIESPLSNNQSIINNNISDNFFNKIEKKTNVGKDKILELATKLQKNDLKNEGTLREIIQELGTLTGKNVSKEKEDKIVSAVINDQVPKDLDKFL